MSGEGLGPEAGSGYPIPRAVMLPLVAGIAVILAALALWLIIR